MHRRAASVAVAVSIVSASSPSIAEGRPGSFGFSIEVDGEGFFLNPTLKSVTVTAVVAASPAAQAGLAPKDQIVEAEGHVIAGSKARDLEPLLNKQVGEALHLKLRRPAGDEYDATLVAIARR